MVQTEEQSHLAAREGPATHVQRGRVRRHGHVLRGGQGRERGRVQAAARPRHVAEVLDELPERRRQCRVLQVRHLRLLLLATHLLKCFLNHYCCKPTSLHEWLLLVVCMWIKEILL